MYWLRFVLCNHLDYIIYRGELIRRDGVEDLEFLGGVCVENAMEAATGGGDGKNVRY